ncbi:MAG: adenylate/guanylate cyclase domain-containing protein, partial [Epsilonproteobacteria bacterium]|nr:adenylate/guanylate cyclase domain-containing protein [Campylobacterota bacterium]
NGYSSGFFNNIPDDSGITRSVPLIIRYEGQIYPSLVLEMIRASNGINKVIVNYNEIGVENIQLGDFFIPTDRYGRLLINFRGKEKSFRYISAVDILENKIPTEQIKDKIFFVGTSAAGLLDLRATPFESIFPGVEVHANAMDNILNNQYITLPAWVDGANIIVIIFITSLTMILVAFSSVKWIPIIFIALFGLIVSFNYHMLFKKYISLNTFFPLVALLFSIIGATLINYFFETKQKELIKQKFSSKVSKAVMEDILKSGDNDLLSAKDKEVTVFFSDVRGFTTISEAMPSPRALIDYLNRYLNPVTEIIIDNEGTIDKYIGDAVMAYWNAPADVTNHQDKALKASLEQFKFLKELNVKLQAENAPIVEIGIGINTGFVTVGEMGSARRSDYTVIGDPINLGSRLESLCKGYGAKIIISEFTKSGLKEEYITRTLDLVRVKGKTEPVAIFEIIDYKEHPLLLEDKESVIKEVEYFNRAVMLYRQSEFKLAKSMFEEIQNTMNPLNKKICGIYIERCEVFIEHPPKDFDGVFTHTTKG